MQEGMNPSYVHTQEGKNEKVDLEIALRSFAKVQNVSFRNACGEWFHTLKIAVGAFSPFCNI